MITTNNTDILFDDFAIIQALSDSGKPANLAIQYGDCGNRFEPETTTSLKANNNLAVYGKGLNLYDDCGN